MSATIIVKPEREANLILPLIQSAVNAEITRLDLALQLAEARLQPFEQKYHISSTEFIESWTAEDLENGDEEYIAWAGEYQLKQRLSTKLTQLRTLSYEPATVY